MSKRLIDANELISAMYYYEHNEGGLTAYDAQDIINKAPTIEPNLILPERMERGDIYEVGETIVVMNHDDYYDLLCKGWEPKRGENLNNEYADCDQFICSECGIELRDWTRVEIDEDDGEEDHYEYVFRFCPNCGARIKGADDEF